MKMFILAWQRIRQDPRGCDSYDVGVRHTQGMGWRVRGPNNWTAPDMDDFADDVLWAKIRGTMILALEMLRGAIVPNCLSRSGVRTLHSISVQVCSCPPRLPVVRRIG